MAQNKGVITEDLRKYYDEFIKGLEIVSIRLIDLQASIDWEKLTKTQKLVPEIKDSVEIVSLKDNQFTLRHILKFTGKVKGSRSPFVKTKIVLECKYSSSPPATPEVLERFTQNELYLHTWPFFRYLLKDTLTKLELPPYTLPLMKFVPSEK